MIKQACSKIRIITSLIFLCFVILILILRIYLFSYNVTRRALHYIYVYCIQKQMCLFTSEYMSINYLQWLHVKHIQTYRHDIQTLYVSGTHFSFTGIPIWSKLSKLTLRETSLTQKIWWLYGVVGCPGCLSGTLVSVNPQQCCRHHVGCLCLWSLHWLDLGWLWSQLS